MTLLPLPTLSPIGRRSLAAANPLFQGLVAYWKLDETSGARIDATGRGNNLTDNNTVMSTSGKVGNAATFVSANAEYLSRVSAADVLLGDADFSIIGWFRVTTVSGDAGLASKWGGSGTEWLLEIFNGDLYFGINNGSASHFITRPVASNTWYFVVATYDATADQMALSVNQGAAATASHSGGAQSTSQEFHIGQYTTRFMNGEVDEFGIYKRKLSAPEQSQWFNGGAGMTLP